MTIRALAVCVVLVLAAGSLSARLNDDSSRYVVKTDSLIEFHASATFSKVVGVFHTWEADLKMPGDKFTNATLVLELTQTASPPAAAQKTKKSRVRTSSS